MAEKVEVKKKMFECGTCEKSFKNLKTLKQHERFHLGEFKCEICRKDLASKGSLYLHQRTHTKIESSEKMFKCDICRRHYSSKGILKAHQETHTSGRFFSCSDCQLKFITKQSLEDHEQSHIGKSLKCAICKKGFSSKYGLEIHLRSHTGENPYKCRECGESFKSTSSRNYHELKQCQEKENREYVRLKVIRNGPSEKETTRDESKVGKKIENGASVLPIEDQTQEDQNPRPFGFKIENVFSISKEKFAELQKLE